LVFFINYWSTSTQEWNPEDRAQLKRGGEFVIFGREELIAFVIEYIAFLLHDFKPKRTRYESVSYGTSNH